MLLRNLILLSFYQLALGDLKSFSGLTTCARVTIQPTWALSTTVRRNLALANLNAVYHSPISNLPAVCSRAFLGFAPQDAPADASAG